MFATAWREMRAHPGRLTATIIAIALSVAYLTASQAIVETEGRALGLQTMAWASTADVVVQPGTGDVKGEPTAADIQAALARIPGVAAAEPNTSSYASVKIGTTSDYAQLIPIPAAESLRWFTLKEGRLPTAATEVALGRRTAADRSVGVGSSITVEQETRTVVGIVDDPKSFTTQVYVPTGLIPATPYGAFVLELAPGADSATVISEATKAVSPWYGKPEVTTGQQAAKASLDSMANDLDVVKYLLIVFGAIAMVVGGIIIANTFAILVTQRRRQIGLLRAVGASSGQVQRDIFAEAALVGLVGVLVGVAAGLGITAGVAVYTESIHWGLSIPWPGIVAAGVLSLIVTLVAAAAPILRASRVAPLEALRPVPSIELARRTTKIRAVVCGIFLLGGAAAVTASLLATGSSAIVYAVVAGAVLTVGVLAASPIFIPWMLRGVGRLVRPAGPTLRLAAANSVRNPGRSAITATALMLTIGLVVTLQVGASSLKSSLGAEIDHRYPLDLSVTQMILSMEQSTPPGATEPVTATEITPIPAGLEGTLRGIAGVKKVVALPGGQVIGPAPWGGETAMIALVITPDAATLLSTGLDRLSGTTALVSSYAIEGAQKAGQSAPCSLRSGTTTVQATCLVSALVDSADQIWVSPDLGGRLFGPSPGVSGFWLDVPDRSQAMSVTAAVSEAIGSSQLSLGGALPTTYLFNQVLDVILTVITGLLGVAILIALVGVANTLGLSVIERARESALLRALGMQKAGLRRMLLYEALLIAGVATAVGILAGLGFGWLGVSSVMKAMNMGTVALSVNWPQTLGLIAVALGAAAVASILPGRRAARATPVEALAED